MTTAPQMTIDKTLATLGEAVTHPVVQGLALAGAVLMLGVILLHLLVDGRDWFDGEQSGAWVFVRITLAADAVAVGAGHVLS